MTVPTYRDLAWNTLLEIIHEAAENPPRREDFESALAQFHSKFHAAIDTVPAVAAILDQAERVDQPDEEAVDPINRADDIAAHLTEKLQDR